MGEISESSLDFGALSIYCPVYHCLAQNLVPNSVVGIGSTMSQLLETDQRGRSDDRTEIKKRNLIFFSDKDSQKKVWFFSEVEAEAEVAPIPGNGTDTNSDDTDHNENDNSSYINNDNDVVQPSMDRYPFDSSEIDRTQKKFVFRRLGQFMSHFCVCDFFHFKSVLF